MSQCGGVTDEPANQGVTLEVNIYSPARQLTLNSPQPGKITHTPHGFLIYHWTADKTAGLGADRFAPG